VEQTRRHPPTTRRAAAGRIAVALVAAGGVAASIFALSTAGAATNQTTAKKIVVSTAKNSKLGTILVSGKTLYTLNKSDCTRQCLKYWPELVLPKGVTKATAGTGVSAAKLGAIRAAGGALQVTYSGRALYHFLEDTAAGQVRGNGLKDAWGTWSAIVTAKPKTLTSSGETSGTPVSSSGSSTPTASTTPTTSPTTDTTSPTTATTSPTSTTSTTAPPKSTTTTMPSGGGTAF